MSKNGQLHTTSLRKPVVTESIQTHMEQVDTNADHSNQAAHQKTVMVRRYIEQCLRYFLNKNETKQLLHAQANIEPDFTTKVWEKLELMYPEFFSAYTLKRRMADQILAYNFLYKTLLSQQPEPVPSPSIVDVSANIPVQSSMSMQKPNPRIKHKRTHDDLDDDKENLNPNIPPTARKPSQVSHTKPNPAQQPLPHPTSATPQSNRVYSDALLSTTPILSPNNMYPPFLSTSNDPGASQARRGGSRVWSFGTTPILREHTYPPIVTPPSKTRSTSSTTGASLLGNLPLESRSPAQSDHPSTNGSSTRPAEIHHTEAVQSEALPETRPRDPRLRDTRPRDPRLPGAPCGPRLPYTSDAVGASPIEQRLEAWLSNDTVAGPHIQQAQSGLQQLPPAETSLSEIRYEADVPDALPPALCEGSSTIETFMPEPCPLSNSSFRDPRQPQPSKPSPPAFTVHVFKTFATGTSLPELRPLETPRPLGALHSELRAPQSSIAGPHYAHLQATLPPPRQPSHPSILSKSRAKTRHPKPQRHPQSEVETLQSLNQPRQSTTSEVHRTLPRSSSSTRLPFKPNIQFLLDIVLKKKGAQ